MRDMDYILVKKLSINDTVKIASLFRYEIYNALQKNEKVTAGYEEEWNMYCKNIYNFLGYESVCYIRISSALYEYLKHRISMKFGMIDIWKIEEESSYKWDEYIKEKKLFKFEQEILKTSNSSLIYFGDNILFNNKSLIKVIIPENVISIADGLFAGCEELQEVVFNSKKTYIGRRAFANCRKLKKVVMNKAVRVIYEGLFSDCINLEEVYLPDGIIEIKDYAFANCEKLKEIHIPKSIKNVSPSAFMGCKVISLPPDIMHKTIQYEYELMADCNDYCCSVSDNSYDEGWD